MLWPIFDFEYFSQFQHLYVVTKSGYLRHMMSFCRLSAALFKCVLNFCLACLKTSEMIDDLRFLVFHSISNNLKTFRDKR